MAKSGLFSPACKFDDASAWQVARSEHAAKSSPQAIMSALLLDAGEVKAGAAAVCQVPGEAGRHRHVRSGRCLGRVEALLREKQAELYAEEPAPSPSSGRAPRSGSGQEDDHGEPRPCRPSGRGLG